MPCKPGDAVFRLEGEKATEEIESLDAGILHIPADGPKTRRHTHGRRDHWIPAAARGMGSPLRGASPGCEAKGTAGRITERLADTRTRCFR